MARSSKKPASPPSNDPFEDVDAKSITEIELDQRVDIEREALPAAARLTDLPMTPPRIVAGLANGAG